MRGLHLRLVCEPVFVGDIRERASICCPRAITVDTADEIKQLFLNFKPPACAFTRR